jgi:hypothetical protein
LEAVFAPDGNLVWTSPVSLGVPQIPYVVPIVPPKITKIDSSLNSMIVAFSAPTGGNPDPTNYLYSLDGSSVYFSAGQTTSPIQINVAPTVKIYSIRLKSIFSAAGSQVWESISDPSDSQPYVAGTAPSNISVSSALNSIVVSFSDSTGSYPPPSSYLYLVSGDGAYVDTSSNSTTITIPNLNTVGTRYLTLKSVGRVDNTVVWESPISVSASGQPYVAGSIPTIISVVPGINSLTITFNPTTGGYPVAPTYQYALFYNVDASFQTIDASSIVNGNSFTLYNLYESSYDIYLRAINGNNWKTAADFRSTRPYITGSTPQILSTKKGLNSITVVFSPSTGGSPDLHLL